ncbi:MAG: hypothetical protein U9R53_02625 [Chloroflexota bacterium]|nr:hypothetical protein [Chloroflexota bacterium]
MSSAYLSYVLRSENTDPRNMIFFLEGVIEHIGQWGVKQVVADLDIASDGFEYFRQAGFSVIAKQRVYHCQASDRRKPVLERGWQIWTSDDIPAIQRLYQTLVPPLIQPVEPLTRREMLGLVYFNEHGALQAYADLVYGPVGVWVLPMIHPRSSENVSDLLAQMLLDLPERSSRPIFVAVRSYQPWVEQALENLNANPGPEQVLLVRYLALQQRVEPEFTFASIENSKHEPTIPLAPIKNQQK